MALLVEAQATRGLNVHDFMWPAVASALRRYPFARRLLRNAVGLVELVCCTLALVLRIVDLFIATRCVLVVVLGFAFTLTIVYVARWQRTLALRVVTEIGALYVLLHATLATVALCDVFHWDPPLVFCFWPLYLWKRRVLFLDAEAPVARRARLGFIRPFALVVSGLQVATPMMILAVRLANAAAAVEPRRALHCVRQLLGFLASKRFKQFVWRSRFFWRELLRPRDAFKLLKRRELYEVE